MLMALLIIALLVVTESFAESRVLENPKELWVLNVTNVPANWVTLFQTVQGVVNRAQNHSAVMLIGLKADADGAHEPSDAAVKSLKFLRDHYTNELTYDTARVLADPWKLFSHPVFHRTSHLVLCSTDDAPEALYAALTLASIHGHAAAVCANPKDQATILRKSGLTLLRNISGQFPRSSSKTACADVNTFVKHEAEAQTTNVFSTQYVATWGAGAKGKPTQGFDMVTSERMLVMCLDSQASDFATVQTKLLSRYAPLSLVFGWWTKEPPDIKALSLLGLSFLGGGHNLALYSRLPPLIAAPQPGSAAKLPDVPASASLVVFAFSQGDCMCFNQKFNVNNLDR
jgi:hypothetical protein